MFSNIKQRLVNHYNPAYKVKVLDYTFSSEPSINSALPLKKSSIRLVLFIIGCILSMGLVWLVTKWSATKKSILMFMVCGVIEADYFLIEEEDNKSVIVKKVEKYDFKSGDETVGFKYHERFYLFNGQKDCFLPIRYQQLGIHLDSLKKNTFKPYPENLRDKLQNYYGQNSIKLPIQSKFQVFIQQMLTPYQVFQTYAIILWIVQEYYLFAIIIIVYSLYCYWEVSWQVTKNQKKLAKQAFIDIQCKIIIGEARDVTILQQFQEMKEAKNRTKMRNSFHKSRSKAQRQFQLIEEDVEPKQEIVLKEAQNIYKIQMTSSTKILPGDLIILQQGDLVPSDCLLLTGQILVNEGNSDYSSIVRKSYLHDYTYISQIQSSFTLYHGSKIVKTKNDSRNLSLNELLNSGKQMEKGLLKENEVLCLVTATGFSTHKGKYLRQIRHYKKKGNSFTTQSIYFIYILLVLTLFVFLIILTQIHQNQSSISLFHTFLDLISTSIPPTLPTALSFGIKFAQNRLKKKNIHCVLPENILAAGKIDCIVLKGKQVFCKDYRVNSVLIGIKSQRGLGSLFTTKHQYQSCSETPENSQLFFYALASCHTIESYQNQIKGSVQEKQIFRFSEASILTEDRFKVGSTIISVKNRLYFKIEDKQLGVVVDIKKELDENLFQDSDSLQKMNISENCITFLKGPPEKILSVCKPNTYPFDSQSYIVDMAQKGFQLVAYAYNYELTQRQDLCNFTFLGFVVLQRIIQQETLLAIQELKNGNIQVIFLSQQRQLETNSIAISNEVCGKKQLLSCSINKAKDQVFCKGHIEWESEVSDNSVSDFIKEVVIFGNKSKLSLTSCLYQQTFMKRNYDERNTVFNKSIIFSRMQYKHQRNLFHQLQVRGKVSMVVGRGNMVSDNADVSLELQRGDSSLFSSFHTKETTLQSVVNCLKICRAGLSTNFHCFNMMILLSLVQFTTISILQYNFQNLSSQQTLYEDLFISFPIFITMNMTQPTSKLSKQKPIISFFSKRALLTMIGMTLLQLFGQLTFILILQRFKIFSEQKRTSHLIYISTGQLIQSTVTVHSIFVLSNFVYLGVILGTSISRSFRKPFYTNPYYTVNIITLWIYNILIVFVPSIVPDSYNRKDNSDDEQFMMILALIYGNLIMLVLYLYESVLDWIWRKRSLNVPIHSELIVQ